MEAIYLNNFRIALPVAFPATRRPTRMTKAIHGLVRWPLLRSSQLTQVAALTL